eukprot:1905910-Rhodomonas_salina.1
MSAGLNFPATASRTTPSTCSSRSVSARALSVSARALPSAHVPRAGVRGTWSRVSSRSSPGRMCARFCQALGGTLAFPSDTAHVYPI